MNNRRKFLLSAAATLVAAPAVVHSSSLMAILPPPVKLIQFYGNLYMASNGGFMVRTSDGAIPFDMIKRLNTGEFIQTGPVVRRYVIVDFERRTI